VAATGSHAYGARRLRAPAFAIALLFAAGIALAASAHLSHASCAAALLLLLVVCGLSARTCPLHLRTCAAGGLALAAGALRFAQVPEPAIAAGCPGTAAVLRGSVIERDSPGGGRRSFTLEVDSGRTAGGVLPPGIRLRVTPQGNRAMRGINDIPPGSRVRVRGTIAAFAEEGNPCEFSPSSYWHGRGLSAEVSAREVAVIDTQAGFRPAAHLARLREALSREIAGAIPGVEGELMKDMLTGERSGIPREMRDAMIDAGVGHILAVSGYRVLLLGEMAGFLLSLARVTRRARAFFAAPLLLFYMLLTGSRPPVVRATVMALLSQAAPAFARRVSPRNALGTGALVILIADPRQLFDPGFQLSFAAVLAVQAYAPGMARWLARMRTPGFRGALVRACSRGALLSAFATLGALPISAAAFGRVSLIGVLTNMLVVPATGLAMVLGVASLATGGAHTWAGAAYAAADRLILRGMLRFSRLAASVPCAAIETPGFDASWTVAWYAAMAFFPFGRRGRRASLILLLAALNVAVWSPRRSFPGRPPGALRVTMIDVGQGDAFLVEQPGDRALLIDAGGCSHFFDAGKERVLPFLKRRRIRALDALLITHPDIDHAGGAPAILRGVRVGALLCADTAAHAPAALEYVRAAAFAGTPVITVKEGMSLRLPGGARIYVLSPRAPAGEHTRGTNDRSVVVRVVYGGVSFLFTGDAGERVERRLVGSYGRFLASTVLKVAHHGSDGATGGEFLAFVHPQVALVSVGRGNRYGHPAPGLIARLAAAGAHVLRTDCAGAAIVETDGRRLTPLNWRAEHP